jgi:hypothetical protein
MDKKLQIIECIDCGVKTNDFYLIPNNRGKLYKCKNCYELSLCRNSRSEYMHKDIHYTSNSIRK